MAAVQLSFTLRTSAKCKTVHLVGSWDNYAGQLPLSTDTAKAGGWKGTFRFQGTVLQQGQRYWYYYIIDGYHVSHDPARESTTEPTTGRKLNILDIPHGKGGAAALQAAAMAKSSRHSRQMSTAECPKGRALSPSQIQSPLPSKPYATRTVTAQQYSGAALEQLARQYAQQKLVDSSASEASESEEDSGSDSEDGSDVSSDVPSLTSRSSNSSSPSSVSSGSCCTCERYAITRGGGRVKLDCGGQRCGYSDASSECSSESEGEKARAKARAAGHGGKAHAHSTRRQGLFVRR